MDATYLRITNLTLLFTLLYFYLNSNKNIAECSLAICVIFLFIFAQIFWQNPIKNSLIHKIDGIVVKILIISFILYVVLIKKIPWTTKLAFLMITGFAISAFYLSDHFSSIEWCSECHIMFHGISHIFCFIGTIFAFV